MPKTEYGNKDTYIEQSGSDLSFTDTNAGTVTLSELNDKSHTHAEIDTHIANVSNPHSVALAHSAITGQTTNDHHNESHTVASHGDTAATGAELETLTDDSMADSLHRHSELSASDGSPNPVLSVSNDGNVGLGTTTPSSRLTLSDTTEDAMIFNVEAAGNPSVDNVRIYTDQSSQNYNAGNVDAAGDYILSVGTRGGVDNSWKSAGFAGAVHMALNKGNVGVGTTSPTAKLDVNSDIIRLRTSKTPSSASDTGNAGDIAWDADYIYVCVATNTWKRTVLNTW